MGVKIKLHDSRTQGPGEDLTDLNRFLQAVGVQDERALVLSLATFIEDTLGRLLLAYFRTCKATRELVEGFSAPLGTLGSRIKAGYAFGLLTEQQYQDLEILRKVRNEFAHDWEGVSLARNDVAALVGQLSGYTLTGKPIEGDAKQKLFGTLSCCCIELQIFLSRIKAGKAERAPDVSHRLQTTPSKGHGYRRYVS